MTFRPFSLFQKHPAPSAYYFLTFRTTFHKSFTHMIEIQEKELRLLFLRDFIITNVSPLSPAIIFHEKTNNGEDKIEEQN